MRLGRWVPLAAICVPALVAAQVTPAQRVIEFRFTPTARAQIALWLEKPDGSFVKTFFLTQAVGLRGIGNRPGASEMNSGFHWPYGRREGALPIWAHRRAAAPGAAQFKQVIFQDRTSEGFASRTSEDSTSESYFCLSFNSATTEKDALDAVSCASGFNSDKGRFLTATDVAAKYGEPLDLNDSNLPPECKDPSKVGANCNRTLDLVSLYPPRRDATRCSTSGCADREDVATYADHARQVMPDIDSVTMATPLGGDREQSFLFAVPADLTDGDYVAWAEVNTEGDTNATFTFSTPDGGRWDSWAQNYGYSYRGQPSVAFRVPITVGRAGSFQTAQPTGYGDVSGFGSEGGVLHPMDSKITNDSTGAPGSGVDRLRLTEGKDYRLQVVVRGGPGPSGGTGGAAGAAGGSGSGGAGGSTGEVDPCLAASMAPQAPSDVQVTPVTDVKHSHEWGHLHFVVAPSAIAIHDYDVRVSTTAITSDNPESFDHARGANVASLEDGMLVVPTTGAPGTAVDVDFGQLQPSTSYFVAIRAKNQCAALSPYVVGSFSTTKINFTKLSGCFVATAAYGSALEPKVEALRKARDALRSRSPLFAAATDLYYRSGPVAANVISRSDTARAVFRTLLAPVAAAAQAALPLAMPSDSTNGVPFGGLGPRASGLR